MLLPPSPVRGRFGLSEDVLDARLRQALPAGSFASFEKSRSAMTSDPGVAAAAYAYVAVLDRLQYGTLPKEIASEALRGQAAAVAAALAARPEKVSEFWTQIDADGAADRLAPLVQGLALGWQARWAHAP